MRQGGHICEDALWEGGDVIAMQGPEERRGCRCLIWRQSLENWLGREGALCGEGCGCCEGNGPTSQMDPALLATGRGEGTLILAKETLRNKLSECSQEPEGEAFSW